MMTWLSLSGGRTQGRPSPGSGSGPPARTTWWHWRRRRGPKGAGEAAMEGALHQGWPRRAARAVPSQLRGALLQPLPRVVAHQGVAVSSRGCGTSPPVRASAGHRRRAHRPALRCEPPPIPRPSEASAPQISTSSTDMSVAMDGGVYPIVHRRNQRIDLRAPYCPGERGGITVPLGLKTTSAPPPAACSAPFARVSSRCREAGPGLDVPIGMFAPADPPTYPRSTESHPLRH